MKKHKSPYRRIGGTDIVGVQRCRSLYKDGVLHKDLYLQCPNCYTTKSDHIDSSRFDWYYCRNCGYENDLSFWQLNQKRKAFHKARERVKGKVYKSVRGPAVKDLDLDSIRAK